MDPCIERDLAALVALLRGRRVAVLTGAGCSTESGIPDYRGPGTRARARRPIRAQAFFASESTRRRYWARAMVGWERFASAAPNEAHRALVRLEREARLTGLITQNVDRLHQAAGSASLVELHGALADVRCLACGTMEARASVQRRLSALNPDFALRRAAMAPDGDADLDSELVDDFIVADCRECEGPLKPDVVFFGENVPRERVDRAMRWVDEAEALLVVGSSLAVFSGYRFALRARDRGLPIAIINLGESRADSFATLRLEAKAGVALPRLAAAL